jgi:hypothetical protein
MKHLNSLKLLTAGILLTTSFAASAADPPARLQVPLDGTWEFRMDPKDEGLAGHQHMKTNLTIFSFLTAFAAFGNCAFEKSPAEILTQPGEAAIERLDVFEPPMKQP